MKRQYQLAEHVKVIDARDGIVEIETSNLTVELVERLDVMSNRHAEELDLPEELVHARLSETVVELTMMTLFAGTRDVTNRAAISRNL